MAEADILEFNKMTSKETKIVSHNCSCENSCGIPYQI
jgi:hypothetical protein